jgi:hypothetical protein
MQCSIVDVVVICVNVLEHDARQDFEPWNCGLGHASIELTLNTYSHALPGLQKRAAEKMDGILGGQAGKLAIG